MGTKSELSVKVEEPKLQFAEKRTKQIYLRVRPSHAAKLEVKSEATGVSMAELMDAILELAIKEGVI